MGDIQTQKYYGLVNIPLLQEGEWAALNDVLRELGLALENVTDTLVVDLEEGNGVTGDITVDSIIVNNTTLDTVPVAGMFEYDGCRMYVTNVATQRTIDRTGDVAVATVTVASTTTETVLWTGSMSANSLCAGNLFKFHADGIVQNNGNNAVDQITLRIRVGGITGTAVATLAPKTKAIAADSHWHLDANAVQRTIGSSGQRAVHIDLSMDTNSGAVTAEVVGLATIDTTKNMDVVVTAQWASSKATNTISLYQGFMEYKN